MNISQVLKHAANAAGFYRREEESHEAAVRGSPPASPSKSGPKTKAKRDEPAADLPSSAQRYIGALGDFDVRRIRPRELSDMSRRLQAEGLLGDEEVRQFAAIRVDLDRSGCGAEEPVDLLMFYTPRATMEHEASAGDEDALDSDDAPPEDDVGPRDAAALKEAPRPPTERVALVHKLAVLQMTPVEAGVNTLV